jgi:hypothetical protein
MKADEKSASFHPRRDYWWLKNYTGNRENSVGIVAMGYGFDIRQGQDIFIFSTASTSVLMPTQLLTE